MAEPPPQAFPTVDPVGPVAVAADDRRVATARNLVADVLAPGAAAADRLGVPRATLDALAAAGLMSISAPPELGGAPAAVQREVAESVLAGDGTAWFCWVQHHSPVRTLAAAEDTDLAPAAAALRDRLLPDLLSGRALSGIAFAHLRRPGPPPLVASRVAGGWRLTGSLDWVTSWDIADQVLVMAQGEGPFADRVVQCFIDAVPAPGLEVGPVLELLAMGGTHTRPLRLDGVHVTDEQVVAVVDRGAWLARDAARTADAPSHAFGLTRAAVADLHRVGEQRGDDVALSLAASLARECREVRAEAYDLADAAAADHATGEATAGRRLELRAHALELGLRATAAHVALLAGRAMMTGGVAERRYREAAFLLVQAQTATTRRASLQRWVDRQDGVAGASGPARGRGPR